MSSRKSLGGSALRDSSSRMNARSRRQSFGGEGLLSNSATPQKDRRAMLDEWRRQSKGPESTNKRVLDDAVSSDSKPPLSSAEGGMTALERYRLRKQQKLMQHNDENAGGHRPPLLPPSRSAMTFEDEDTTIDLGRGTSSLLSSGTPSFSRRLSTSGKARRRSFSVGARMRETLSQESREPESK